VRRGILLDPLRNQAALVGEYERVLGCAEELRCRIREGVCETCIYIVLRLCCGLSSYRPWAWNNPFLQIQTWGDILTPCIAYYGSATSKKAQRERQRQENVCSSEVSDWPRRVIAESARGFPRQDQSAQASLARFAASTGKLQRNLARFLPKRLSSRCQCLLSALAAAWPA
jgi:hypothetical protein